MNYSSWSQLITYLLNRLIAKHCLFCLQKTLSDNDLCDDCLAAFAINDCCCKRCASPMEEQRTQQQLLCGHCLSHHSFYDKVYSPYRYTEDIRYLITKLKYQKKIHFAKTLAELFIKQNHNNKDFQQPQLILPMPMHVRRLRERGYNQALELSRFFASFYSLPLDYSSIVRSRYTELQAGLAATDRQKNVANAFTIKKPLDYKHIALVDDVMTTGSSANEVAKLLKISSQNKGVMRIDVWTIARAGIKH